MRKRLEALKKDQKGFTLVELIVVLVILAILAALLVPALLGYIDRARNAKYLEEARSIYTAIQAINDEEYVKSTATHPTDVSTIKTRIDALVDPTAVTSGTVGYLDNNAARPTGTTAVHKYFTVSYIDSLVFVSQDGTTINAKMDYTGNWTVDVNGTAQTLTADEKGTTTATP